MNAEMFNKRKRYYSKTATKFELIKAMKDREVIFMDRLENWKCIRGLMIRSTQMLDYFFSMFKFFEKDYNIYVSLAKYNYIPRFTTKLIDRSKETRVWFDNTAKSEIKDYDIFLDFDCKDLNDFQRMKIEIYRLITHLYNNDVCFTLYPSGKNYQVVIKNYDTIHYLQIKELLENIKKMFKLEFLDFKGAGVFNKIRKCQYSLVNDICIFPLDHIQELDKNYNYFDCNNILYREPIRRRGLKYINDMGEELNKKHLKEFLTGYLLWEFDLKWAK